MERQDLLVHAQDALAKLHHPSLLQIHPLAGALVPDVAPAAQGIALKDVLLDAMRQIRPPHTTPLDSAAWRRYRSLLRFYLDRRRFDDIAREQGVSERQSRRDVRQAVDEMGELLWARYCQIQRAPRRDLPSERPRVDDPPETDDALWEAEIERIGSLPAPEPIRLESALRDAVALADRLAARLGIRIALTIGEALPAVSVNQTALRQALLSVLGWALDACPAGELAVSAAEVARGVEVAIQVAGPRAGRVGDADDDSRLRLGQRLLEMQGGKLEIKMRAARGLHLLVVLPSARAPAILVVDDNPDVVRLFQRYLQTSSIHLIQAMSAEQALRYLHDVRPRLITLDLMMPSRDGWDLLEILKRDRATRDIPIAVCSVVHERALAMAMGASYFLPKPVSRAALLDVLARCGLGAADDLQARPQAAH